MDEPARQSPYHIPSRAALHAGSWAQVAGETFRRARCIAERRSGTRSAQPGSVAPFTSCATRRPKSKVKQRGMVHPAIRAGLIRDGEGGTCGLGGGLTMRTATARIGARRNLFTYACRVASAFGGSASLQPSRACARGRSPHRVCGSRACGRTARPLRYFLPPRARYAYSL